MIKSRNNKFDLFVSLGAACSCSKILRRSNLQYRSYPFDWLYGSTFLERIQILASDFENWLNLDMLEFVGVREIPDPRKIYLNKSTKIVFNHDFDIDAELNESYPKVKEKYDRRISRLLQYIENSNNVLFVYIEAPDTKDFLSDDILINGLDILQKRFQDTSVNLLYCFNKSNLKFKEKQEIKVNSKITKVCFDYDAYNKKESYAVNHNVLLKYFKKYEISNRNLTFGDIKRKILHKFDWLLSVKSTGNHTCITILGVKFNIRSYRNN